MHFLFFARFFTCDWRLPPHYKWASLTSWTETGLSKPAQEQGKDLWKQMAPSQTLSFQSNSTPSFCKRLDISMQLFCPGGCHHCYIAGFAPASCLTLCFSELSWDAVLKLVLQNYDERPGKRQTNFYYQSSTFIENLLSKTSHLVQNASA